MYNITPLDLYKYVDPRLRVNEKREFVVEETGMNITYQVQRTATTPTTSSCTWTTPPPSPGVFVGRKLYMVFDITFTLTGVGNPLLVAGKDAPRAFPINSVISSYSMTINGNNFSSQPSLNLDALMRYNNELGTRITDYSLCPAMLDNYANYDDAFNSNRNPLGLWSDDSSDISRGGFPYAILVNGNGTATVRMKVCEPVFISPFTWGKHEYVAFIGLQTFNMNIQFSNFNRIWSRALSSGPVTVGNVIFNTNPELLFTYITPKDTFSIPKSITYSYFKVQTVESGYLAPLNAGASFLFRNNGNIQLECIPKRIYICVGESLSTKNTNTTDTYMAIESVSINFNNKPNILAEASKQHLYEICANNGYSYSWSEWSGEQVLNTNLTSPYALSGGVMCVEMKDLGLDAAYATGVLGAFTLNIQVTAKNNTAFPIMPSLYITTVSVGTVVVEANTMISNIGVISKQDVIDVQRSKDMQSITLNQSYGGNFLSGVKDFGEDILSGIKEVLPYVRDVVETVGPLLPLMGLGQGGHLRGDQPVNYLGSNQHGGINVGGVQVGGKKLNSKDMKKRIRNM